MKIPVIDSFGLSDIGTIRPNNEDVIALLPSHNFFTIADGMGGHRAGEVAAKEATTELIASFMEYFTSNEKNFSQKQITSNLVKAIEKANKRVFTLGQENQSFKGMGTTICCLYIYHNWITYAHVGDSRVYLFRKNKLTQLTKDHSLLSELNSIYNPSLNRLAPLPYKNIITKAVGTNISVEPSIKIEKYYLKDRFLMCTDGLSDYISNEEISYILSSSESVKIAIKKLIEAAKNNGSRDNISGLLIEIKDIQ